jgi:hypothetical protein
MTGPAAAGRMAREIAARLTAYGHEVRFPPGRDVAVFQVTSLPGDPHVEVRAEDAGWTGCHYTARAAAEVAEVTGRLPATALPGTVVAAWGGIDVEWHCIPSGGQPAHADHIAGLLLAHIAVLDGSGHAGATERGRPATAGTGDA